MVASMFSSSSAGISTAKDMFGHRLCLWGAWLGGLLSGALLSVLQGCLVQVHWGS